MPSVAFALHSLCREARKSAISSSATPSLGQGEELLEDSLLGVASASLAVLSRGLLGGSASMVSICLRTKKVRKAMGLQPKL